MSGIIDEINGSHRAGRNGHFIFHAAELQSRTGRVLAAKVFDVVFVGVLYRHFPFCIIVSNQYWDGGYAHVPVRAVAVRRGHGGLR